MGNPDLSEGNFACVREILSRHLPGKRALLFGSRIKGGSKAHSDLDIAIDAGAPLPLSLIGSIEEDFSDSDLPFRVDVIDLHRVDESFRRQIAQDALEIAL